MNVVSFFRKKIKMICLVMYLKLTSESTLHFFTSNLCSWLLVLLS